MPWAPRIDWETASGRTLRQLFAALPAEREWALTLFGSSPLQLARILASYAPDLARRDYRAELKRIAEE